MEQFWVSEVVEVRWTVQPAARVARRAKPASTQGAQGCGLRAMAAFLCPAGK
jgi:hypothetical protein